MDASGLGDSIANSLDSTVGDAGAEDGDALALVGDAPSEVGAGEDAAQPDLCAACAPPPPGLGWSGPFELFELDALLAGDGGPPLPSCGQADSAWEAAFDLHALPDAAPAACMCSCGQPSGSVCSAVATYFVDSQCKTACGTPLTIDAGCTSLASADPLCSRVQLVATLEDAGTCAPATVSIAIPPVSWQVTARLCSPSTAGTSASSAQGGVCEAGVCVPATESRFEGAYCAIYADIVGCPDAGYSVRHGYNDAGSSYYAGSVDTRACSSCACSSPGGVACVLDGGTTAMTSAGACVNPSPSACANLSMGPMTVFGTATATPMGGECTTLPEGGEPTGTLMPTAPYTVCCTQ